MKSHQPHEHDLGLAHDLEVMRRFSVDLADPEPLRFDRRGALRLLGGAGLLALVGCGSDKVADVAGATSTSTGSSSAAAGASTTAAAQSATTGSCEVFPQETAGPYPGDGSNGPNVLNQSGVVRSDIRSSIGSSSTVAQGVPLTIVLTIQKVANGCTPLNGAAVYLWHCDKDGKYSMYDLKTENYLRGVQAAGADGTLTFKSIYPGAYSGRFPHIHFEVFESLAKATSAGSKLRTSQIALPEAASAQAYAASGYEQSVKNNAGMSLARDNVFRDGAAAQTPSFGGDAAGGFTIKLNVPV